MRVLLVHGLGRTPLSMFSLARSLRAAGYSTLLFGYSPTFEPLPRILRRLTERLRLLARTREPVGLVGHSLGGLLLRMAIPNVPDLRVHHLVMLGTPNRPPRIARFAWRFHPFRWVTRDCGRFLSCTESILKLAPPSVPYTLIAGTAGPHRFWGEANDGIVAVSETRILDTDTPLLVPAWHSFIMNHPAVQRVVLATMMTDVTPIAHPGESPCQARKTYSAAR